MPKTEEIFVDKTLVGKRVDILICAAYPEITRSYIQKLFPKKLVFVNDKLVLKHYKVKLGDKIKIIFPDPEKLDLIAQNIPLDIVFEDDQIIIVNKPKGMVVHPAPGNYCNTLVNALMWHCKENLSEIGGVLRPGIVHRIDKDTSGLLVIAKTNNAHISLAKQLKEHSIDRFYEAVVYGGFKDEEGTIDLPIGRSDRDRKKMAVNAKTSREAITNYKVIKKYREFSHIRLKLETGRTHQIRVHMSYLGHPLAGDVVYGPKNRIKELKGQCLHAKTIGLNHPTLNKHINFDSKLPEYFVKFLNKCESMQ